MLKDRLGLVQQAKKWNIDPDKIGILGFSAGGNLAVMASTTFKKIHMRKLIQQT